MPSRIASHSFFLVALGGCLIAGCAGPLVDPCGQMERAVENASRSMRSCGPSFFSWDVGWEFDARECRRRFEKACTTPEDMDCVRATLHAWESANWCVSQPTGPAASCDRASAACGILMSSLLTFQADGLPGFGEEAPWGDVSPEDAFGNASACRQEGERCRSASTCCAGFACSAGVCALPETAAP